MQHPDVYESLVDAVALMKILHPPRQSNVVVFDVRFSLSDPQYGVRVYADGHIPGAYYLHLDHDLSSAVSDTTGRHPLPAIDQFAELMRRYGVSAGTQVFFYDDAGGMFAARGWWLMKWLGHEAVAVLDGGLNCWLRRGGDQEVSLPELPERGTFEPRPRPELLIDAQQVQQELKAHSIILCDARAPERYRGDVEPLDKCAGHVPGAVNVPFAQNLDAEGCFKPIDELRRTHSLTELHKPEHQSPGTQKAVVHMCGSGVTACHNVLAAVAAGLPMPILYAGSWSQWISDPTRPIAKGAQL